MSSAEIQCSQCHSPIPKELWNLDTFCPCPACSTLCMTATFPLLTRPDSTPVRGQVIVQEGEASCFFHAKKRAEVSCSMCGRFLCRLCEFDLQGTHLCPSCLQIAQTKEGLVNLEKRRVLYDSASLGIALYSILFWPITIVSAPIAVGLAIYSFKKPNSLIHRGHFRAWLAILIGSLQIVAWIWAIMMMFQEFNSSSSFR